MSRLVFMKILDEVVSGLRLEVGLSDPDKEELYQQLLYYFGLIGGLQICKALESAWQDSYNQNEIKEFITAWLRRKARKTERTITGLV